MSHQGNMMRTIELLILTSHAEYIVVKWDVICCESNSFSLLLNSLGLVS